MCAHDAEHGGEPESAAGEFGREKGIENLGLDFFGNTGAVIRDFYNDRVSFLAGIQADFPLAIHRRDSIVNDVGPNLI